MRIISWNVNGLRAVLRKDALHQLLDFSPDLICLQEIKAKPEQLSESDRELPGYNSIWNPAIRPGYSGVLTYSKTQPKEIQLGLQHEDFDPEGRVIRTDFGDVSIFNIYFPNGQRGQDRVDFKLAFYDHLLKICRDLQVMGREIIIGGDFNTAHKEIDLANPRENEMNSGFLPEERIKIDEYIDAGFVDIYRERKPEDPRYTWWTYRFGARARNIGWRIDYFMITKNLVDKIVDVDILDKVEGSDHCPVLLEFSSH
jgi:exodeoxyribonuclease III